MISLSTVCGPVVNDTSKVFPINNARGTFFIWFNALEKHTRINVTTFPNSGTERTDSFVVDDTSYFFRIKIDIPKNFVSVRRLLFIYFFSKKLCLRTLDFGLTLFISCRRNKSVLNAISCS